MRRVLERIEKERYIDQLWNLVNNLKNNPFDTRHTMTAEDPAYFADPNLSPEENIKNLKGCLNPCHYHLQCFVTKAEDGAKLLSLKFDMRSTDAAIGQ